MSEITVYENTAMYDTYGEAINGPALYSYAAATLKTDKALLVGWTDGKYSHHDLMFVYRPDGIGNVGRGLRYSRWMLFVSVISCGTFGFHCDDRNGPLMPDYVNEKLSMSPVTNETAVALTVLINGVMDELEAL